MLLGKDGLEREGRGRLGCESAGESPAAAPLACVVFGARTPRRSHHEFMVRRFREQSRNSHAHPVQQSSWGKGREGASFTPNRKHELCVSPGWPRSAQGNARTRLRKLLRMSSTWEQVHCSEKWRRALQQCTESLSLTASILRDCGDVGHWSTLKKVLFETK